MHLNTREIGYDTCWFQYLGFKKQIEIQNQGDVALFCVCVCVCAIGLISFNLRNEEIDSYLRISIAQNPKISELSPYLKIMNIYK